MCVSGYGWHGGLPHGIPFLFIIAAGFLLLALLLYLNRKQKSQHCDGCGNLVQPSFLRCPACGHELKAHCPACNRIVESSWQYCPHCREPLLDERAAEKNS